jgi:ribA/ribD-fused uncharacterized protein
VAETISRFTGKHAFLSNFYPCSLSMYGEHYNFVEHAFQAAKSLNPSERTQIRLARTPRVAKALGSARGYAGFRVTLREDWEDVKYGIMEELVRRKFRSDTLGKQLLDTGDAILIEGNDHGDRIWGAVPAPSGRSEGRPREGERLWVVEPGLGGTLVGKNWLGLILMKVRSELSDV